PLYVAAAGSTVTITQVTAGDSLVLDPHVTTIEPCYESETVPGHCGGSGDQLLKETTVLYSNSGMPPIAADDSVTTETGQPVRIDVLKNDDTVNGAPITALDVSSGPGHGTAKVKNEHIVYTSKSGFSGTDTFDYALSTANGTATATVTVRVKPLAALTPAATKSAAAPEPPVTGATNAG